MTDANKRVDESWKEQVAHEKQEPAAPQPAGPAAAPPGAPADAAESQGMPEARFDLFISGLAVDALIALGDMAHPSTRKQAVNLPHARYLIDLLGLMADKTKGNLTADEERLLKDALYQLRVRYLAKSGG